MSAPEQIEKSGLTDAEIAALVGSDPSSVWRWRRAKVPPHRNIIGKLAEVLNCSPADLRPDLAALFEHRDDTAT